MNLDEILVDLSSNSLRTVLDAVTYLSDMVASDSLTADVVDTVFHAIVPLLSHNHYKIRYYAFLILAGIFMDHFEALTDCIDALPSILLSLLSVNQQIKTSAYDCLKIILDLCETQDFWFDIENIITKGRSAEERVRVLGLLRDIADRIPLVPIVKLVDDPMYQIRRAALAVLDRADEESVKQAIRETRVSYDAMKLLVARLPYLGNVWDYLDVCVSTSPMPHTSGSGRTTPASSVASQARSRSRSSRRSVSTAGSACGHRDRDSECSGSHQGGDRDGRSVGEYSSECQKEDHHGRSVGELSSGHKKEHFRGMSMAEFSSGFVASFGASRSRVVSGSGGRARSIASSAKMRSTGKVESDMSSKSSSKVSSGNNRRMGPVRDLSKRGIERKKGDSSGCPEFPEVQRVDDMDLDLLRSRASPQQPEPVEKTFQSGRVELGAKRVLLDPEEVLRDSDHDDDQPRILGTIEASNSGGVFKVQDMSKATWFERQSFLAFMRDAIETGVKINSTPEEMLDCLMVISRPVHKKVVYLIPPVLTALMLRSPEVVTTRLREIVEFTLFAMVGDDWRDDPEFENYLAVLIDTADPIQIINTCISVSGMNERPLPCELLIMSVYEKHNDLLLPYQVVARMVAWLIGKQNRSDSQEELLRFVCKREVKNVIQFGTGQPADVRKSLIPYVKDYVPKKKESTQRVSDPDIKTTDPDKLLGIMAEECAKGKKCDLPRLLVAFGMFSGELPYNIYVAFIDVIGRLPEAVVEQHENILQRLCVATFDRPNFLSFFFDDWVPPERIIGFSRMVWNSPRELLAGSEKLYPKLYEIFLDSSGPQRLAICRIFLAVERATSHSVLELREVKNPYRKLIASMMSQFRVE